MSNLLGLFEAVTDQLMEVPVVIVLSTWLMGGAIIWQIFFEGKDHIHDLRKAEKLLRAEIRQKACGPILVRLAWHDSGTYDEAREHLGWPNAGGATGSIRTLHELNAPANAGLMKAVSNYLSHIKEACPLVSWADLIQMASAVAVEEAGGPRLPMRYGRVDGVPTDKAKPNFGLPDALPPFGGPKGGGISAKDPASHLKWVFGKYGPGVFGSRDIVALSGAHTLGRAFKDRSGTVAEGSTGEGAGTAYTRRGCPVLGASLTVGGRSWTRDWLKFDNSYFSDMGTSTTDGELLAFPTDLCLKTHKDFRPHFEEFARDQDSFFKQYAISHAKLSELGSKFIPPEGLHPSSWYQPWWRIY